MKSVMGAAAIAAAVVVCSSVPAAAADKFVFGFSDTETAPRATLTFDNITPFVALDTGWINSTGAHTSTNPNYITGNVSALDYNSYFSFALGAAAPASPYTSAVLTLKTGTTSGTLPDLLTLFDVDATLLQLDTNRSSGDAAGQALFADLGSGTSYGNYTFTQPTVLGDTVSIQLNQTFLNRVNSGLLTNFSIGGTLTPAVAAVPEPATWAMMLIGFGGLGFAMRRRPKTGLRVRYAI